MRKKRLIRLTGKQLLWLGFLVTRLIIWWWRPVNFTEILFSYMPYAHAWESGYIPYLKQWYEYPPATIPLLYLPHLIDKYSGNKLPYLPTYRGMLMLVDVGLFWVILRTWEKFKGKKLNQLIAGWFYVLATLKAHDFMYDSMDMVFAGAVTLALVLPVWGKTIGYRLGSWVSFWLAVGLKLINAPLAVGLGWLKRKEWKRELILVILGGIIVWAIPIMVFRSSLAVIWVYHQQRGLQADSVGAVISRTIGSFTKTENFVQQYKNFEIVGPVSNKMKKVVDVVFGISMVGFVIYSLLVGTKTKPDKEGQRRIQMTIVFVYLFMLTGKVLSRPFLLWQIPIVAVYPFKSVRQQMKFVVPVLIMVGVSLTLVPLKEFGGFTSEHVIGWIKSGCIGYLLWQGVKLGKNLNKA